MKAVVAEWEQGVQGEVRVTHGRLASITAVRGGGRVEGPRFSVSGPGRVEIAVDEENVELGAWPTMVTVATEAHPFTFLLRDVHADCPIWIPAVGVAVTEPDDTRSYVQIAEDIRSRGLQTALQRIASEPEESYQTAAAVTRSLQVPTWLGLSRDMRTFEVEVSREKQDFRITAHYHGGGLTLAGVENYQAVHRFAYGRGPGPVEGLTRRRLEDGVLPILRGTFEDDDVHYHFTTFVTLERSPLTAETLRGTHYLVANGYGYGVMLTEAQRAQFDALQPRELEREEETVLYYRVEAVNTGQAPRYAWFQAPDLMGAKDTFDGVRGFRVCEDSRIRSLARINGNPLPKPEVACLLRPGETATFEFRIPHRPVSRERGEALAAQSFAARHAECRAFWQAKLAAGAQVSLPEPRLNEMLQAGLLHLDLVAYGLEPDGSVAATIGGYNPIGSESSPIIQYFDSVGWHDLARRSLNFFLDLQHEDGFMQNFGDYMLETGAALWTMGEHFRYTQDREWVKAIKEKVLKSCDFMLAWRGRNLGVPRGEGHGMMEGKVADPEDPFRTWMLNGYAYLGLARTAEMLAKIDPKESARLASEAEALKADLREELRLNFAKSPVVPLGDGTWSPTAASWAEGRGPVCLLTDENLARYGTFTCRDSLLGPHYLILQEVLSPHEQMADRLLEYTTDLYHQRNVALGQPYYSEHTMAHLQRGEVKAFLKQFYNGYSALADRETYSFWETFAHASAHKTHEEGWFLMQTRWMLYLEEGDTLRLLAGIPRAWLGDGKRIAFANAASYFGPVSLEVVSEVNQGRVAARVTCESDRRPKVVAVRLPHPEGRRATGVRGGEYDPATETVRVEDFTGQADVVLAFD